MHIALIAPTSMLNALCSVSKVQMCLAHRVLSDAVYADFYKNARAAGQTVVMDNSLWELGTAMSYEYLQGAYQLVQPDELIIPDVFRDGPATIKSWINFHRQGPEYVFEDVTQFVVVHGQDREEWLNTYDYFVENTAYGTTLGLPKVLDEIWSPGGRIGCVEFLEATNRVSENHNYHCLGIWDDPIEILLLGRHSWIRSLDTALPIHAGMGGVRFHRTFGLSRKRPKRPHIYFEASLAEIEKTERWADIRHNVTLLQEWANGK